jgi:hypothetical protein
MNYFFQLVESLSNFARNIYKRIISWFSKKQLNIVKPLTIIDETNLYIQNKKTLFERVGADVRKDIYNTNVDSLFFNKKDYSLDMEKQNNDTEKIWKTRILFESTPRGNIIMYFDVYKLAFAYYCDTQLPYPVLNAVAMKYVTTFFCRDFFLDDEFYTSPLIKIHINEENKKKQPLLTDAAKTIKNDLKGAPFAKFKNYAVNNKHNIDNGTNHSNVQVDFNRNRFVNLGKICNFSFLSIPVKHNHLNGFKTHLLDGVQSESELQKQVLSYKDFKNSMGMRTRSQNK